MDKLSRDDLWTLEDYAARRADFRAKVIEHKKRRKLHLGANLTLLFEDRLTIQYQVQEMLRIERVFERAGIDDELAAYNPLIPDGSNWKATCLIEFEDPIERADWLARLRGVERMLWAQVGTLPKITPIADEDLERANETKTSAVHFLRFELNPEQITALRQRETLRFGVDHPEYRFEAMANEAVRESLIGDLA